MGILGENKVSETTQPHSAADAFRALTNKLAASKAAAEQNARLLAEKTLNKPQPQNIAPVQQSQPATATPPQSGVMASQPQPIAHEQPVATEQTPVNQHVLGRKPSIAPEQLVEPGRIIDNSPRDDISDRQEAVIATARQNSQTSKPQTPPAADSFAASQTESSVKAPQKLTKEPDLAELLAATKKKNPEGDRPSRYIPFGQPKPDSKTRPVAKVARQAEKPVETRPEVAVEVEAPVESAEVLQNIDPLRQAMELLKTNSAAANTRPEEPQPENRTEPPQPVIDSPVVTIQDIPQNLNKSEESGQTARLLLDIMSQPTGATQPQERSLAGDTLLQLVDHMDTRDIVRLVERVGMMEDPPVLLVNKLINHPDPAIAGPLLENAITISDQELLEVIEKGDADKMQMIARRRQLSKTITDALIARGDIAVFLTIVRNPGAQISHDSFVTLSKTARNQPALHAPLATRGDTPAPVAFELFWFLPVELRRYILSRFLTDSATLDKILKIARSVDGTVSDGPAAETRFPSKRKIDSMIELIENGVNQKAFEMLASLAVINEETASRIISDPDGEPLTIALKAMGYGRSNFEAAISRFSHSPHSALRSDRDVEELKNMYESLSFNKARTLLTYWDWAVQQIGPYRKVN